MNTLDACEKVIELAIDLVPKTIENHKWLGMANAALELIYSERFRPSTTAPDAASVASNRKPNCTCGKTPCECPF